MHEEVFNALMLRIFCVLVLVYVIHFDMQMNVQIVTASWRSQVDVEQFLRVGISRMSPRHLRGYRTYPPLYPGPWWRSIHDPSAWAERYQEGLHRLNPCKVLADLAAMVPDGRGVALSCWELPPPAKDWCHRGIVAKWLFAELGLSVAEVGHEHLGCGAGHPMWTRVHVR